MKMKPVTVYGPVPQGYLMLTEASVGHHEVDTGSGFVRTCLVAQDGVPYVFVETENLYGHKNRFCLSINAARGLLEMLPINLSEALDYFYSPPEQKRTQP